MVGGPSGLPVGLLEGLPPIIDARIDVLVLGSFPSPASLRAQQYYAHRQNQFWRIMAVLLGTALLDLDYGARTKSLLSRGIGVWDVYRCCHRVGALDSAIEQSEPNDFSRLKQDAPGLRQVCFNGKTSGKFERLFQDLDYQTRVLPSTSPAYTRSFDAKLDEWRLAIGPRPTNG